ncbi:pentatricopeptide repeat-containing protein 2, mitochondrial isoform X3 [Stegostoma tigrinum]|nr:pentatricopeptide repeat-containing protein 2, mitochondrial isoform X3 [Stegostoma tigrinum]XP_048383001.1 pentatricopeptide repeat-containing protein 2, mitochondrial isoform X3 [Stegostoma tigrinum]XP_048383004.1 pentatricopeptide repeat-containing protein 2, mitochondrial isoform X3 [Stegostoma tigrinum]
MEFQQKKVAIANQMYVSREQYFNNIEEKLKKNELILKDDLKTLLHLCQTPSDVQVAKDLIYRYHSENRNTAFGEFKFGPLFVRLCYELGLEETAEEMVKDQNLKGFFSDSTSFNIVMDMLFMKERYESALGVLLEMKNQDIKFSKDTYTLAFAVCYKMNTSEAYKICSMLLEESLARGDFIPRHAFCFAIALAVKQNYIDKARSIYSHILHTDSKICLNLHVLLLALSGAQQNLLSVLETTVVNNVPTFVKKLDFSQEVLTAVRKTLKNNLELQRRFEDVCDTLQRSGQITALSLDDMLCHTPNGKKPINHLLFTRKVSRRTFKPLRSALLSE